VSKIVHERNCQKKRISPPITDAMMIFFINNVRFKEELGTKMLFKIRIFFEKIALYREFILWLFMMRR
jgi:hypothetical protein